MNSVICDNMDGPWRFYVKWNKSDEDDKYHIISVICEIWDNKPNKLIGTETRLVTAKGERGCRVGEMS